MEMTTFEDVDWELLAAVEAPFVVRPRVFFDVVEETMIDCGAAGGFLIRVSINTDFVESC